MSGRGPGRSFFVAAVALSGVSTDERVVLVTGAAGGIGSAIALAFADAGWRVYATDLEQPPESVRERCRYRELDVSDADRCRAVVDGVLAESGRLDCLVNNAGYAEAERPRARYPVGWFARFVRWTHVLPATVVDPIQAAYGRVSTALGRTRQRLASLRRWL